LTAAALSVLLLFFLKPPLLRVLKRGADPAKSNVDALLGTVGTVVLTLSEDDGQVKLANGETWTARFSPASAVRTLQPGERVLVTAIDGSTAIVIPAERTTP
jgi:membrane protein implicated in regulation of membrane protease activity